MSSHLSTKHSAYIAKYFYPVCMQCMHESPLEDVFMLSYVLFLLSSDFFSTVLTGISSSDDFVVDKMHKDYSLVGLLVCDCRG